jgi:hypothetical protein
MYCSEERRKIHFDEEKGRVQITNIMCGDSCDRFVRIPSIAT